MVCCPNRVHTVIELHNQLIPVASSTFGCTSQTSPISNNLKYSVTEAMYRYNITTLKLKGKTARHDYACINLPNSTHIWIITLGIRKPPLARPYRRSKAGQKLFHQIHSITTWDRPEPTDESVWSNDVSINKLIQVHMTIRSRPGTKRINLLHINAHSICNKIPPFQQHILQNKVWPMRDNGNLAKGRRWTDSKASPTEQLWHQIIPNTK